MLKSYNKIRLRDFIMAVARDQLKKFNNPLAMRLDANTINYVGTQNQKDHEFVCIYDVRTDTDETVRMFISPRLADSPQFGTITPADEIDGNLAFRLWINIDEGLFNNGALGIPVDNPYYAWRCPNLDLYLFEAGALEHESIYTAILYETGGMIYLEDPLVDTSTEQFIWETEARIRDLELIAPDITKPFIVPNPYPAIIAVGDTYEEPGAKAFDNITDMNEIQVNITGEVNTVIPGTYVITYQATDTKGNYATARRSVEVKQRVPTLELYGDNPHIMKVNTLFFDPGALAWDFDGNPLLVKQTNNVITDVIGEYTMTYTAITADNTIVSEDRIIQVVE